ncbi:thioredoxin family protein [Ferrimonas balearica]|uniref:thioredoxin family protein n=1 Tax=Ferrimonas balearica TaxID=44012 RepID=UPI001F1B1E05|nr:thioredoxin family protein [Ferrimonas balearica]MBY6096034.1 thioredoxin family protein [Ferrimonas balearica]
MKKIALALLAAGLVSGVAQAQPLDHKRMLATMGGVDQPTMANPHGSPHGAAPMQDAVLTGELDPNKLIFELVPMGRSYLEYQVDTAALAPLQGYDKPTEITVVVGTWCGDCHTHTPAFIKIMKALNNANIQVRYIGVDKQGKAGDVSLDGIEFESIPTFIVSQGGNEIGRIAGAPKASLEQDLVAILTQ